MVQFNEIDGSIIITPPEGTVTIAQWFNGDLMGKHPIPQDEPPTIGNPVAGTYVFMYYDINLNEILESRDTITI